VLFNGFQKKSQKTPTGELDKAVKIMNDYFDEKLKRNKNENKKSKK
jgi:phage-related protein